ncbi:hypothetical protein Bca4012_080411 [Brassica carinata]
MMKSLTLLDLISLPAVYVAISSGTAGSSSDGAENTAAIVVGGLALIAAASSILLQVGKDAPAKPKAVGTTEDRLLATTSTSSSLQKLFRLLRLSSLKLHRWLGKKLHCQKLQPVRLSRRSA